MHENESNKTFRRSVLAMNMQAKALVLQAVATTLVLCSTSAQFSKLFPLRRARGCFCLASCVEPESIEGLDLGRHDGRLLADLVWYRSAVRLQNCAADGHIVVHQPERKLYEGCIAQFIRGVDITDVYARLMAAPDGVAAKLLLALNLKVGPLPGDVNVGRVAISIDVRRFRAESPGYLRGVREALKEVFRDRARLHVHARHCLAWYIDQVESVLDDFVHSY